MIDRCVFIFKGKKLYIFLAVIILIGVSAIIFCLTDKSDEIITYNSLQKISEVSNDKIIHDDNLVAIAELKPEPKSVTASVPIFMYHFILDDYGNYPDVENFMKPETLEQQIKYIVDNEYQTIFVNEIESLEDYTKPVALTFDDCFVYFYNNAFTLVKKYNVKVTLNIIYEYINGENYLTTEQIKEMLASGLVSVESHTMSHKELIYLNAEEKRRQIIESNKNLEKDFGIELTTICYPVGKYDKSVIEISKEEYKYGLAMTGGVYYSNIHKNLYAISRIYANRSMTLNQFASYLKKSSVKVEW